MAGFVSPDKPTYAIDASNLADLPDDLRDALSAFYAEREIREAEAYAQECLDYQTLQADTLLGASKGWVEVDLEPESIDFSAEMHWVHGDFDVRLGGYTVRERYTLHEFYRDLYGLGLTSTEPKAGVFGRYGHKDWDIDAAEGVQWPNMKGVLVNHRDREHPYEIYQNYWDFYDAVKSETSYVYMGSFWQPPTGFLISKRNAMNDIGGFCVDIDRFEDATGAYFGADWVMNTLLEVLDETPELEPNYIMLTGTGIQLWYVFGERIPLLSKKSLRRQKYGELLKLLYKWFDKRLPPNRFKVDVPCAAINHAFRAPGSPSKQHYPTRLFVKNGRARKLVDPLALSHFLGGRLMPYDLGDWDQFTYETVYGGHDAWKREPATAKQLSYLDKLMRWHCIESVPDNLSKGEADELIKQADEVAVKRIQWKQTDDENRIVTSEGHRVKRKMRNPGLYQTTISRMAVETPAGTRYNAMVGVAGLGWNCGIPRAQVEQDLMSLLDTDWAKKKGKDGLPLSESDVKAAVKGWHPLGALRKREQLEHRLGWSYERWKRNGRKQSEHLRRARITQTADYPNGEWRNKEGRPTKEDEIKAYAAAHPNASQREIAGALGVSKTTVNKWLKKPTEHGDGER